MKMEVDTVTNDCNKSRQQFWKIYKCSNCGGLVSAVSYSGRTEHVAAVYPPEESTSEDLPAKARSFLQQAMESIHAPAGAVMLAASSIDAMLKEKGYKDGTLNSRIIQAAKDHVITEDMAKWAHQVRLEANDQRHSDEGAELPTEADAKRSIEFAKAMGQFMFVLPAMVTRGLKESTPAAK